MGIQHCESLLNIYLSHVSAFLDHVDDTQFPSLLSFRSPRPVIVEQMALVDDNEGMSEININKRNPEYVKERQQGPRFAHPGSFEYE